MAQCNCCGLEMTTADGCVDTPIVIRGRAYQPVRHGDEPLMRRTKRRCGDCNVLPGQVHHHGCDMERCPACGWQSITCDCIWSGEEHLNEAWIEELEERFSWVGPDEEPF